MHLSVQLARIQVEMKRKREADPILTYSNILSRALKHRKEHDLQSTNLGVVLEHMTRTTRWIPSVGIMRRGLYPMHYQIFECLVTGKKGKDIDWWTPKAGDPFPLHKTERNKFGGRGPGAGGLGGRSGLNG